MMSYEDFVRADSDLMHFMREDSKAKFSHDLGRPPRIGIVGYSDDSKVASNLGSRKNCMATISSCLHNVAHTLCNLHGYSGKIDIVSGLTDVGIPGIAYHLVTSGRINKDAFGKTVGIACAKAKDYPRFPVDEKHIIGSEWGDESEFFVDYIDALVRIGGGEQSHREVALFKSKYPTKPIIEIDDGSIPNLYD